MRLDSVFFYALKNISKRSLRSWLTIIGIIIGVITIVVILSISEGVQKEINDQLSSFGPDNMFVIPINIEKGSASALGMGVGPGSAPSSGKLTQNDVEAIKGIPGVKSVTRFVYGRSSVSFKDSSLTATVYGADKEMFELWGDYIELENGRYYQDGERGVVVLANDAANKMFGKKKVDVGNTIYINEQKFRVIGVLKLIGTSLSQTDDSAIYVSYDEGKDLFKSQLAKNEVKLIMIKIDSGYEANEIKGKIESKLCSIHKVSCDEKDFSVITAEFVNQTIGSILFALSAFIFLVTVVASIVGGIGIMNTMFMGVLERVQEIGILKSIGASEKTILTIFMVESGVMGLIGGLIGTALGIMILLIIGQFGVPYVISPTLMFFVFAFSISVGVAAGYLPARQAAKLDPVEALNYE